MNDVTITLDKSKPFSTCHGERTEDDPYYRVHFLQGGKFRVNGKVVQVALPFDSNGDLVPDDGKDAPYDGRGIDPKTGNAITVKYHPLYSPLMRQYLAAKIEQIKSLAATAPVNEAPRLEDEVGSGDALEGGPEDLVNFADWLRGKVDYQPFLLRKAAHKRYHKQYPDLFPALVVDLVLDEKLVPEAELRDKFRAMIPNGPQA